ncbi:MAG: dipeptidase [Armatimonadota bacterium]|jgi:membrane dipeptidase
MPDLDVRMQRMREKIDECHARARECLGATDAQVQAGFELHENLLVCDSFGFTPNALSRHGVERINEAIDEQWQPLEISELAIDMRATGLCHDEETFALYREMFRVSGVNATVNTAGVGPALVRALRGTARFTQVCDARPDFWRKAIHSDDARRAFDEGRRAMFLSANNPPAHVGYHDGYDVLTWLETFHRFGYRVMHLTYNRRNLVGDGCTEPTDAGLSDLGHQVVEMMNRFSILIDTPHSGVQTTLDACRLSKAPVAATHTVCRDISGHPRGKTDEQLRAIAETGGFAGMTCIPHFLAPHGTIVDLLDHIERAVDVMGIDHVGIGTDVAFTAPPPVEPELKPIPPGRNRWWALWPEGTGSPGPEVARESSHGSLSWICWPYFTVGLPMRGYTEEQVGKIVGGNILRVLDDVEAAAEWAPRRT